MAVKTWNLFFVMRLSSPVQSIIYAVATKSVGSVFRVSDDWSAPEEVRDNTMEREGILLGLSAVFTTAIQLLFTHVLASPLAKHPKLKQYELLLRGAASVPALVFAEWVSRKISPRPEWDFQQKSPHSSHVYSTPRPAMVPGGDVFYRGTGAPKPIQENPRTHITEYTHPERYSAWKDD